MLSPAVLLFVALCLVILLLQQIQQRIRRHGDAKKWGCQPPLVAPTGFLGIPGFIRMTRAAKKKHWVEFVAERYSKYGNTFQQTMLGHQAMSTIDPENIKALLATQFNDFCLGTRLREFYPVLGAGIFTLDGAGWSHSRALLRPQFTRDQVADLCLMDGHVSRLIELVPKDGSIFDIQRLFFLLTIDSATHFLFGESVGAMEDNRVLGNASVGNAQGFAEAFNLTQEYLAYRSMALSFYWMINPKEFRDATRRVHEVVDYYVHKAIEAKRHPEKKEPGRYILAEALAADNDDPKVLRDSMLNILLAGRDTTSSLLSSVFYFLARHPAIWEKLRHAIVDEFGDSQNPKADITHARLKDIPYLRYVLNEALRLLPPVPLNFRVAAKDTSLPLGGGPDGKSPIYIKNGMPVMYSIYAMHRRKDLYGPDADSFRPERWEENAKRGWEYLPFNGGPRICLGQQYALTEASYTMVKLMQRFTTVENGDPGLKGPIVDSKLTMVHGDGVKVRLY
ncbi:cytochrome P450 [Aspergillus cavernicola]|uniref:Cytochrome P450 n=1 Tax=Aspergillus cavernicola TaxID=176166 RepID=A0ABR4IXT6_9EURO